MRLTDLAKMIDHSLLHPTMTDDQVAAGCDLARRYDVATVCVKPCSIGLARRILEGSSVGVCAVVAFPHGNSTTRIKLAETQDALDAGAVEIDMVINIGKALGSDWAYVREEIRALNAMVAAGRALLKVIFENDYLDDRRIVELCRICSQEQVAFIKTSTGYGFVRRPDGMYSYKGATDAHLKLMREVASECVQIKAAGGVRTLDDLLRVRALGVTRVGATATAAILDEARQRGIS